MSFSVGKSLLQLTSGLLKSNRTLSSSIAVIQKCSLVPRQLQVNRSFTRSLWSLCPKGRAGIGATATQTGHVSRWNKTCGCCGLHTKGDEELDQFLGEEIEHELKTAVPPAKMPKIHGFDVSLNGSDITLTKVKDGETITIEMNINHSVQDASGAEYGDGQQSQENAAEMVAHPPFTVKIKKGGDLTLAMQCDFPDQEGFQQAAEGQEDYVDAIEITEVAMIRGGEWEENVYSVSGSVMDGNLYDMLMNLMEERGITGESIDQIIDYATAYDQQKYINFLEDLQSFVKAK